MAVAVYQHRPEGKEAQHEDVGPKGFPAPKRAAELKYWYKEARKVINRDGDFMPDWSTLSPACLAGAEVEVEVIRIGLPHGTLWIDRKARL